jgi:alkyl hydroperoxide reductase subunit AhpC
MIHVYPFCINATVLPSGSTQNTDTFDLYEYLGDSWGLVFMHPGDFTRELEMFVCLFVFVSFPIKTIFGFFLPGQSLVVL